MRLLFVSLYSDAILNCVISLIKSLEDDVNCDLLIYDFNGQDLYGQQLNGNVYFINKKKSSIANRIFNYFFGNIYAGYFSNKKLRSIEKTINSLNRQNCYDAVVTCSGQYKIHEVQTNIPIHCLYLVDPFYFNHSFSNISKRARMITEKQCFRKANYVFCPSTMRDEYLNNYHFASFFNKIIDLEFPLIFDRKIDTSTTRFEFGDKPRFLYLGSFYNGIRNPKFLINFF